MRRAEKANILIGLVLIVTTTIFGCKPDNINASSAGGGGGGGGAIPAALALLPDSSSIVVNTSTNVRATVRDASGAAISNVTVTFTITAGSGTLNPSSGQVATNSLGEAVIQFTAGATPGTVTIQAAAGALTNTTNITIASASAANPASISVNASPSSVDIGGQSIIVATVRDASGNVLAGKQVDFAFDSGGTLGTLSAASATTDGNGQATVTFVAGTLSGTAVLRATATGFPAVTSTTSVVVTSLPASLSATVSSSTIYTLGNTSIIVTVNNSAGNPVSDGTVVNFTSSSLLGGTLTASALTVNGVATATYQAANTPGTVTVSISCPAGTATSITTTISVQASPVGSIQFVSATPNSIAVKSSGGQETALVQFSVKDTNGGDIADGTQVRFTITGPNGGEYIGQNDATPTVHTVTTSNGIAQAYLASGFNAGPVKVTATVLDSGGNPTAVSSSSTGISIGGGKPTAKNFSVSATTINLAGLSYDNLESTINVLMADRFGNSNVLEGTSVSFYTEAGAIKSSNVTDASGVTSEVLRTQDPRPIDVNPAGSEPSRSSLVSGLTETVTFNPRDGWVKVLVVTRGEEKFDDLNGNGSYDGGEPVDNLGEPFIDANNNGQYDGTTEAYTDSNLNGQYDRGEPFTDANGNGVRDQAEFYIDADQSGSYTGPNTSWDSDINIWKTIDLVFTGGPVNIDFLPSTLYSVSTGTALPYSACETYIIDVSDKNLNTLMAGSTVSVTCDAGTLTGGGSFTMPDGLSEGPYSIDVTVCDETPDPAEVTPVFGGITVTVTWKVPGVGDLIVQSTMPGTSY